MINKNTGLQNTLTAQMVPNNTYVAKPHPNNADGEEPHHNNAYGTNPHRAADRRLDLGSTGLITTQLLTQNAIFPVSYRCVLPACVYDSLIRPVDPDRIEWT